MRFISIVFVAVLAISVPAQTPLGSQSFEKGTRLAETGQYATAIISYRQALVFTDNEKPEDDLLSKIHYNIGVCLYKLKDNVAAVGEFTEAIKLSRRNYQRAFYALGMTLSELKNQREAEIAFRQALKLKKADGEAWFDLGFVYLQEKNFEAAENAFKNAVKYKSVSRADAHNNIGVIFALRVDFSAATREFETALAESAGSSKEARNNLLFCKSYQRNHSQNLLAMFLFSEK